MYQNPMNDFYLRQAQPYQQTFNFPPQQPQIKANWVSSIDMNYIIKKSFFIISFKSFFYIIHT